MIQCRGRVDCAARQHLIPGIVRERQADVRSRHVRPRLIGFWAAWFYAWYTAGWWAEAFNQNSFVR